MNREEQIKAIYEKVGATRFWWNEYAHFDFVMIWDVLGYRYEISIKNITQEQLFDYNQLKKIDTDSFNNVKNILKLYKKLRKPIEEQSGEAISFIFDLINSN